jgi:hypothetical protein
MVVDEIVNVVAVRNLRMPALGAVDVLLVMTAAAVMARTSTSTCSR